MRDYFALCVRHLAMLPSERDRVGVFYEANGDNDRCGPILLEDLTSHLATVNEENANLRR
jgi:hypothetical protein